MGIKLLRRRSIPFVWVWDRNSMPPLLDNNHSALKRYFEFLARVRRKRLLVLNEKFLDMSSRKRSRKRILRCPHCEHRFEAEDGDNLHPYCDVRRPKETDVADGSIKEQLYDCLNPQCKRPITVYWYQPKGFFFVAK